MSEPIVIAVIAAMPGILMTLGTIYQVRRVHVLVNSQKDALTRLLREALVRVEELEKDATTQTTLIRFLERKLQTREEAVHGAPHETDR